MSWNLGLTGRVVLITGAAGGLGRGIAEGLAAAGARLVLSDLPGRQLHESVDAAAALSRAPLMVPANLSEPDETATLVARVVEQVGQIDAFVACAGIIKTTPFAHLEVDEWDELLRINLSSTFQVLQGAANHMAQRGRGSAVLLSSVAGRSGRPNSAHYAASKAALISLTKSAAMAYSPRVRVNAVCPGVFLTPMWRDILSQREIEFGLGAGDQHLQDTIARVPLARVGEVAELANVVTFLLSDRASYVTGQAINVDGGLEMH